MTHRWSSLIRYGLLAPGTLVAAAATAQAEPCDDHRDPTVGFTFGVELSPRFRMIGGVEGRACMSQQTEALVRIEIGGGAPRLIAGVRARPFDTGEDERADLLGLEAGGIIDTDTRFAVHLAGTFGTHAAYLATQGRFAIDGERPHVALLGGFSPWAAVEETAVPGRPLIADGRYVCPAVHGARATAVHEHFARAAQLELSSVWTFLRLAAELVAVGAPAELIAAALDAADDEVRHAEQCAATAGVTLAALPMAAAAPRFVARDRRALAVLAGEAWHEGCLGEGAAAEEARLVAEGAAAPMQAMLAGIARDEARHAELSWRVLAWIRTIDASVVAAAVASRPVREPVQELRDAALVRFGVPSTEITRAAIAHAEHVARARLA